MRIDGQEFALEMARDAADLAQGHLQALGFGDGVCPQELVNGLISGHERQSVSELESFLGQGAFSAQAAGAQGGLMDQLQRQTRLDAFTGLPGPSTEQIPSAQAQVLGDQQPKPDQIATDFIGQELPHATFQAAWVTRLGFGARAGALGFDDGPFSDGTIAVEFFFAGRIVRSLVRHCEC
jgi:hypothetical protein